MERDEGTRSIVEDGENRKGNASDGQDHVSDATDYLTYRKRMRKREVNRWVLFLSFLVLLFTFLLLPIFYGFPSPENMGPWFLGSLGLILLTSLALYILDRKSDSTKLHMPDFLSDPATGFPDHPVPVSDMTWEQQIVCWPTVALISLLGGFPLITGIILALMTGGEGGMFCCAFCFWPVLIIVILLHINLILDIKGTTINLKIGFRWSKYVTIPLQNISTIRPVTISALGEFMGWGRVHGVDGSNGYISSGKVGVRIHLMDGTQYVVTVKDPQSLIDFVNWWRSVPAAESHPQSKIRL